MHRAKRRTKSGKPTKQDNLVRPESKGTPSTASTRVFKTICLCMIVKNESKIIERCLESAKPIIDYLSIVDTGSEDDTVDIIENWCTNNQIEGKVHHETFKNFAHNRTDSAVKAKQTFPEADYLLLLDADMILKVLPGFDKRLLFEGSYQISQKTNSLFYWNTRMINTKYNWACLGVTHEFWRAEDCWDSAKINTLAIDDRNDGGCKSDKFERDKRLLLAGIEDPDEPDDIKMRYKFYLGQTLKDLGEYTESIRWYDERIKDGGFPEEVFYSRYMQGSCLEKMAWNKQLCSEFMKKSELVEAILGMSEEGEKDRNEIVRSLDNGEIAEAIVSAAIEKVATPDEKVIMERSNPERKGAIALAQEATKLFDSAVEKYIEAWNTRQTRSEPLYAATKIFRCLKKNNAAFDLAMIGKNIPFPVNDSLFVENNVYEYLFDYELSIVSYYVDGKKSEGKDAIIRLIERQDLPEWIQERIKANCRYYL